LPWASARCKLRSLIELLPLAGPRPALAYRHSNPQGSALSTLMNEGAENAGPLEEEAIRREDAEAVARTLAGQTPAYDRLIERYQRRAVAVAYRLLGNIEDAMDVCQEAYLRAFRSLASLQEPQRFGAWLMRIVTNLSLNYRRGRRVHLSLTTDGDGGGEEDRVADLSPRGSHAAGNGMLAAETDQAVTRAIESLPEQQRLALILFAIEGVPQKEVADILQCSVEMVKWNVFQARKKLKELLIDYLET
jgi:RNA polymerase sigma-70 factor, ECF subfamily